MKLDFNNPIFVLYLGVQGMPRIKADEMINFYKEFFNQYENITIWIIPRGDSTNNTETKIELLFGGQNSMNSKDFQTMKKDLEKLSGGFSEANEQLKKPGFFQRMMRNIKLGKILDE